jgi:starvation-inducible DNA-binding protein
MELIAALKKLQANSVVLYSTAHGFHWNVEGPLFTQYHAFFEEIYSDVYGTIDAIAEWIRKFDAKAPYTLEEFTANNTYGDVQLDSNSPIAMSKQLLDMIEKMQADLIIIFDQSTSAKQQGLANFVADRQDKLQFWSWWLKSSIKSTIN